MGRANRHTQYLNVCPSGATQLAECLLLIPTRIRTIGETSMSSDSIVHRNCASSPRETVAGAGVSSQ